MRTYGMLRELIRNKYGSIKNFSQAVTMETSTLQRKLCGKTEWKTSEIEEVSKLLGIKTEDIPDYFFY